MNEILKAIDFEIKSSNIGDAISVLLKSTDIIMESRSNINIFLRVISIMNLILISSGRSSFFSYQQLNLILMPYLQLWIPSFPIL